MRFWGFHGMLLLLEFLEKEIYEINFMISFISSLAKCLVQETVQFNGYFGCSCCEIPGKNVSTAKNGTKVAFPPENKDIELRNWKKTLAQASVALETNSTV